MNPPKSRHSRAQCRASEADIHSSDANGDGTTGIKDRERLLGRRLCWGSGRWDGVGIEQCVTIS